VRFRSVCAVTWTVPDAAASAAAFAQWLGFRRVAEGHVNVTQAAFWGAPAAVGAPFQMLQPASGAQVFLRLIEAPVVPGYAPLETFGWNAAEMHVADVGRLADRLRASPFRVVGGPRDLLENNAVIAMQVLGPGGEMLYLTEMRHAGMRKIYGFAVSEVDRVFIAVLGASDQARTMDFYRPCAARTTKRRAFPIKVLAAAHGLDPDTARFDIASAVMEEAFRIEVDAYPDSARARPVVPGHLPPGMCMVSVQVDELPGASSVIPGGLIYERAPAAMLRGPDGEMIELLRAG